MWMQCRVGNYIIKSGRALLHEKLGSYGSVSTVKSDLITELSIWNNEPESDKKLKIIVL